MKRTAFAVCLLALPASAFAQDIRGMEVCTAEKQMERRTSCLQANGEFLQQALVKLTRETRDKQAAADRELANAKAEIATLKAAMGKLEAELKDLKAKPATADKKQPEKP